MNFKEKQLEKEQARSVSFFLKDATNIEKIFKDNINAVVYSFTKIIKDVETPLAIAFVGNAKKYSFYYRYNSPEERAERIESFFDNLKKRLEWKNEHKLKSKKAKDQMADKIQVGTLLHGSWGYEQTNCEFYQVIEKLSKYKVVIREIGGKVVEDSEGHDCCDLNPVKDSFTNKEPITKMIGTYGISFRLFHLSPCSETDKFYSSWYY